MDSSHLHQNPKTEEELTSKLRPTRRSKKLQGAREERLTGIAASTAATQERWIDRITSHQSTKKSKGVLQGLGVTKALCDRDSDLSKEVGILLRSLSGREAPSMSMEADSCQCRDLPDHCPNDCPFIGTVVEYFLREARATPA